MCPFSLSAPFVGTFPKEEIPSRNGSTQAWDMIIH
jgi:hypothetical protein